MWFVLSLYSAQLELGSWFGWEPRLRGSVWSELSTPRAGGRGSVARGYGSACIQAKGDLLLPPSLGSASPCMFFCPSKGCGFFGPGKLVTRQLSCSLGVRANAKMALL